jgi:hypothetical protein
MQSEAPAAVYPSPGGRYRVVTYAVEARMSHWLQLPQIEDLASGDVLCQFRDSLWSLDQALWQTDTLVRLLVRKYPGGHQPTTLAIDIDCLARKAHIGADSVAIEDIDALAERSLRWADRKMVDTREAPRSNHRSMLDRFADWLRR